MLQPPSRGLAYALALLTLVGCQRAEAQKGKGPGLDLDKLMNPKPQPTPAVVDKDRKYVEQSFTSLPCQKALPAWMTARRLKRALRSRISKSDHEAVERQLARARQGKTDRLCFGPLDAKKGLHLLSLLFGTSSNGVVLFNAKGRVLHAQNTGRGSEVLLKDVAGDSTPEIIVPYTVGPWASIVPRKWEIYMVAPRGRRLRRIASISKYLAEGSRWARYCFFNQVRFPRRGELEVKTLLLGDAHCAEEARKFITVPRRLHQLLRYRFVARRGRFVKQRAARGKRRP